MSWHALEQDSGLFSERSRYEDEVLIRKRSERESVNEVSHVFIRLVSLPSSTINSASLAFLVLSSLPSKSDLFLPFKVFDI